MSATYEFWLLDDGGRRIVLLDHFAFFSYSRTVAGFATLQIGLPFREFDQKVKPYFAPDRRIDVWRSSAFGYPMRREGVYLLRKPKIYTRDSDGLQMIEFFGRGPLDLIHRRFVVQKAGNAYTEKTAAIDDMMKAIVREQMLFGNARDKDGNLDDSRAYPQDEFSVQDDLGLGPVISRRFAERNVLDVLKELKDTSFQLNVEDVTAARVYFDVIANELASFLLYILDEAGNIILDEAGEGILDEETILANVPLGFQFRTFMNLRGIDRTDQIEFSTENGNLEAPFYSTDHFDEINAVYVKGQGRGESRATALVEDVLRIGASRWNRLEAMREASYEVEDSALEEVGRAELEDGKPREELYATILNTPGSEDSPRSLYGVDWDLGDLVKVSYARKQFMAEILIVYVSVDENGVETITGRNQVGAFA